MAVDIWHMFTIVTSGYINNWPPLTSDYNNWLFKLISHCESTRIMILRPDTPALEEKSLRKAKFPKIVNRENIDFSYRFLGESTSRKPIFRLKLCLTDTGEDSKLVHRRKRPKVDTLFSSLFFSDASERRVWLSPSWKYSRPLLDVFACIG